MFFVSGAYTTRPDVRPGMMTFHPAGFVHGPAPGAAEGSVNSSSHEEYAVMLDTFRPLSFGDAATSARNPSTTSVVATGAGRPPLDYPEMRNLDVSFRSEGRTLRGWLVVPDGAGPFAGVVMTSGFAGVKEGFLGNPFHLVVAQSNIVVLLYDHANTGESGATSSGAGPHPPTAGLQDRSPSWPTWTRWTRPGSASGARATREATCLP